MALLRVFAEETDYQKAGDLLREQGMPVTFYDPTIPLDEEDGPSAPKQG